MDVLGEDPHILKGKRADLSVGDLASDTAQGVHNLLGNIPAEIFVVSDKPVLSVYSRDKFGRIKVEYTDHTWGIYNKYNQLLHPMWDEDIIFIHESEDNGLLKVNLANGQHGWIRSDGTWLIGEDGSEVEQVFDKEADGRRRVTFRNRTYEQLLDADGNWVTLTLTTTCHDYPPGTKVLEAEGSTKYALMPDKTWEIIPPSRFIKHIDTVSTLESDGNRLVRTTDHRNILLHSDGSWITIPGIYNTYAEKLSTKITLGRRDLSISHYEFRDGWWLLIDPTHGPFGIKSNGETVPAFENGAIQRIEKTEADGRNVIHLSLNREKQILNPDGSIVQGPNGETDIFHTRYIPTLDVREITFINKQHCFIKSDGSIYRDPSGRNIVSIEPIESDARHIIQSQNQYFGLLDKEGTWLISGYRGVSECLENGWRAVEHEQEGFSILDAQGKKIVSPNGKSIATIDMRKGENPKQKCLRIAFTDETVAVVDTYGNWSFDVHGKGIQDLYTRCVGMVGYTIWNLDDGSIAILNTNGEWMTPPEGKTPNYFRGARMTKRALVKFTDGSSGYFYNDGKWLLS